MVMLSDALGLLCILWHWKPAACRRQDGFIEVSETPKRKRSVRKLKLGRHWTFQQDNGLKHTSNSSKAWLQKMSRKILQWPSKSLDLNPRKSLVECKEGGCCKQTQEYD